ncbi:MAG: 3-oxoacyl-[acyl-carrier-protein] synthase III C-terminal domain-containing protein [Streptosporangiaceae bacterium]|jgi:hypothetical protein
MNGSAFPALASQVLVSVAGAGSYLITGSRLRRSSGICVPARPAGRLLEPEWVVKHLGIHERRLDFVRGRRKRSGVVVRLAVQMLGMPPGRVPVGVDHCGNTSAASTLILLDEDLRAARVRDGDLVVFLWIGAANGAMNGYAAMVL